MKHSKDPFEAAIEEEQEESPPESPVAGGGGGGVGGSGGDGNEESRMEIEQSQEEEERAVDVRRPQKKRKTSVVVAEVKNKDEDEEEEEDEVELTKYPTSSDPAKMAKMQKILSQFTEDQMSRYESFRRSALQKPSMKRLLQNVTGSQKIINTPMTIVCCGIAKMFVGELVEKARVVMGERNESGPIRPCHIRESYRRLKLEGKVPKRSVPRLFR